MSELKICTKCTNEYPATTDYFYISKHARDNLSSWCKGCLKATNYQRYLDKKEVYLAKKRKKYAEDDNYRRERKEKKKFENRGEKRKEYYKKYQQENKEKFREYQKSRKINKNHDISEQEWLECLEFFDDSCAYCGMTEVNAIKVYGQHLHKEHVEHYGVNDITNCVPSCKGCNSQKSEFELNEWYNEDNPIYSKKRYNKIIKWLMSFAKV